MIKRTTDPSPRPGAAPRIRRGYFESRHGQLHVHQAIPAGGGFEEDVPLLALHAAPFSARMFTGLLPIMGRTRSAFAPDLPGFGASDAPAPLSIPEHAAAIGEFIATMRLREIDVLGCGLGALVALELAAAHPAVRRVIIVALPMRDLAAQPQSAETAEAYVRGAWASARADCGSEAALASVFAACGDRLLNGAQSPAVTTAERDYPLRERLRATRQPLLLLHSHEWLGGVHEPFQEVPARSRRALPGTVALFISAPQSIAVLIQDFLKA